MVKQALQNAISFGGGAIH